MTKQHVAIVGLGRVGSAFLAALLPKRQSIDLVCVAENAETPGKAQARAAGIKIATLDEIVAMGSAVDVVFDLTGMPGVRKELREKLKASHNEHTVIAPETIAGLIWSLIDTKDLPFIEGRKTGY